MSFKQIDVFCTDKNQTTKADIIRQSDRTIKIAFENSTVTVELHRKTPTSKVYIGSLHGLEFIATLE